MQRNQRHFRTLITLSLCYAVAFSTASVCAATGPNQRELLTQLINDGKFNEARDLVAKNKSEGADDADFRLLNARLLRLTGRTDEATSEYEAAARLAPQNPAPLVALADLFLQNLELDKSLNCAKQALVIDEQSIPARIAYTTALIQSDQTTEAGRQVTRLIREARANPEVELLVYQLEKKKGDFFAARKALEFVIAHSEKGDPHWRVELAELHQSEGNFAQARSDLEQLVEEDPTFFDARIKLANLLEFRFHDYTAANRCYSVLQKLNPQAAEAVGGQNRCRDKQKDIAYRIKSTLREGGLRFSIKREHSSARTTWSN